MCHAAVGEALGLFHTSQWISDMQFDNVNFGLNPKITIDAFHQRQVDVTEFGKVILRCWSPFSTYVSNFNVKFNK